MLVKIPVNKTPQDDLVFGLTVQAFGVRIDLWLRTPAVLAAFVQDSICFTLPQTATLLRTMWPFGIRLRLQAGSLALSPWARSQV